MSSGRAIGVLLAGAGLALLVGVMWATQRERSAQMVRMAEVARAEAAAREEAEKQRLLAVLQKEAAAMGVGELSSKVLLESVTLMPPLAMGREQVRMVKIEGVLGGKGKLTLDPNPAVVDGCGNVTAVGGRVVTPVEVELVSGEEKEGWKVWEIRPVMAAGAAEPDWVGSVVLRLAAREGKGGACAVRRLIVSDASPPAPGAVLRVVTMEGRGE